MSTLSGTDWDSKPPSDITQEYGDIFLNENKYLIFEVPSVVVPGDFNFLLNPLHKDFTKVI